MRLRFIMLLLLFSVWIIAGNTDRFIASAQKQVGKTLSYNPEYAYIKYPMGDIPLSKGVCTDVVVRAFRGVNIDLQERIYKDKKKFPKRYKGLYYIDKLDPNIDHRRVKNIQKYLISRGYRVNDAFKPGDIVVWKLKGRTKVLDHIGICSDKRNTHGEPLILHNINSGAKEEDVLRSYRIVDHFRVFGKVKYEIR
jgi:uncharacterized protein YijF (DUF1287 family)